MPKLDRVREEVFAATLEVLGSYARGKAERIADRVVEAFAAHSWAVFTEEEVDQLDDLPHIQLDDPTFRDLGAARK